MTRSEIHAYAQRVTEENAVLIVRRLIEQGLDPGDVERVVMEKLTPVLQQIYRHARQEIEMRALIGDDDPDLAKVN